MAPGVEVVFSEKYLAQIKGISSTQSNLFELLQIDMQTFIHHRQIFISHELLSKRKPTILPTALFDH